MGDVDCDDFGIESAMRRARRIRWVNSRTVPYVAVCVDDCAPGLETEPIPLHAAMFDDDCEGLFLVVNGIAAMTARRREVRRLIDNDCDRPSPGGWGGGMTVDPRWVGVSAEVQDSIIDIQGGYPPRHPTHAARAGNYIGWEMGGGPGGRDRWWLTRDGEAMAERIASFGRVDR